MSRFGDDPKAFFADVYGGSAPWDIGGPQPGLLALIDEFPPAEPILDLGCGSGDLAIALAARGHRVIGVDFVESAIAQAADRARSLDADAQRRVRFEVADALRPSALGQAIGAVVDSGFMHLFNTDVRDQFAGELASALQPGGRYYVLAFAVTFPIENGPLEMTAAELEARFTAERGWRILASRPAEFLSRVATVPAIAACMERAVT
jgi:SAM-dependent methyltransferase